MDSMDMTVGESGMNMTQSSIPDAMSGMSMPTIFESGVRLTLFFETWTTTSTFSYIMTIIVLFLLALLNRFISALKFQIESLWANEVTKSEHFHLPRNRRDGRTAFKAKLSPLPLSILRDGEREWDPLPTHAQDEPVNESEIYSEENRQEANWKSWFRLRTFRWWKRTGPSNWKNTWARAFLEFVRAFIGYILMLAVMTFNTGVFAAVLAGVFIGELLFGSYSGTSAGWQDGSCHDG